MTLTEATARVKETWDIRDDLLAALIEFATIHRSAVCRGDRAAALIAEGRFLRTQAALHVAREDANAAFTAYIALVDQQLAELKATA